MSCALKRMCGATCGAIAQEQCCHDVPPSAHSVLRSCDEESLYRNLTIEYSAMHVFMGSNPPFSQTSKLRSFLNAHNTTSRVTLISTIFTKGASCTLAHASIMDSELSDFSNSLRASSWCVRVPDVASIVRVLRKHVCFEACCFGQPSQKIYIFTGFFKLVMLHYFVRNWHCGHLQRPKCNVLRSCDEGSQSVLAFIWQSNTPPSTCTSHGIESAIIHE